MRVASFDFSENLVLAELYAHALRAAGIPVQLIPNLGPREVVEPALEQGHVDFVVEYLGTALEYVDPGNPAVHGALTQARRELDRVLRPRGLAVLGPAAAQDQNGFVVTVQTAARLSEPSLSALRPLAPSLVLGAPPECPDRPYCQRGLEQVYGLHFAGFEPMDTRSATATALETGEIDVGLLETTDARLADHRFVLLTDDRGLQPRENIVPLVRRELLAAYGSRLTDAVASVTAQLSTPVLVELNRRVEIDGQTPAMVAADWLGG